MRDVKSGKSDSFTGHPGTVLPVYCIEICTKCMCNHFPESVRAIWLNRLDALILAINPVRVQDVANVKTAGWKYLAVLQLFPLFAK